jgi:hypothetical protein
LEWKKPESLRPARGKNQESLRPGREKNRNL